MGQAGELEFVGRHRAFAGDGAGCSTRQDLDATDDRLTSRPPGDRFAGAREFEPRSGQGFPGLGGRGRRREPVGQHPMFGGDFGRAQGPAEDADLVDSPLEGEVLVLVVVGPDLEERLWRILDRARLFGRACDRFAVDEQRHGRPVVGAGHVVPQSWLVVGRSLEIGQPVGPPGAGNGQAEATIVVPQDPTSLVGPVVLDGSHESAPGLCLVDADPGGRGHGLGGDTGRLVVFGDHRPATPVQFEGFVDSVLDDPEATLERCG